MDTHFVFYFFGGKKTPLWFRLLLKSKCIQNTVEKFKLRKTETTTDKSHAILIAKKRKKMIRTPFVTRLKHVHTNKLVNQMVILDTFRLKYSRWFCNAMHQAWGCLTYEKRLILSRIHSATAETCTKNTFTIIFDVIVMSKCGSANSHIFHPE